MVKHLVQINPKIRSELGCSRSEKKYIDVHLLERRAEKQKRERSRLLGRKFHGEREGKVSIGCFVVGGVNLRRKRGKDGIIRWEMKRQEGFGF